MTTPKTKPPPKVEISKWLTLLTNLAVLGGLVLVAYELNQNAELARTAFINEGSAFENNLWLGLMGSAPSEVIERSVACPEKMSYSDFVAMDSYLYTGLNTVYRSYEIAHEGLFTESQWKSEADTYVHWYLGDKFSRAWWENSKFYFEEEFYSHVDVILAKEGISMLQAWKNLRVRLGLADTVLGADTKACG